MNDYLDYIRHDGFICVNDDHLEHHGVKGMKWGVRRERSAAYNTYKTSKSRMKDSRMKKVVAKDKYNRHFNDAWAYSDRYPISQFTNKTKKAISTDRWNEAARAAHQMNRAKRTYKDDRKTYKADKKAYKRDLNKRNEAYTTKQRRFDAFMASKGTEKYINRQLNKYPGMTVKQARTKGWVVAGANTVAALGAMYGGYKLHQYMTNPQGKVTTKAKLGSKLERAKYA